MTTATAHIGVPTRRIDGPAKVTGRARYAAEYHPADLAYGVIVSSAVARGRIRSIDANEALELPGVLRVFTHQNAPHLAQHDRSYKDEVAPPGSPFRPLCDGEIRFAGQPIALVVAETFELARYAATLVRVEYEREPHETDLERALGAAVAPLPWPNRAPVPKPRGDAAAALARAPVRIEVEYRLPDEHHNPMELFAATAVRDESGLLTVYDKTQGVQNVRDYLCRIFDCSDDELRVISPYVGGAFGIGLRPQYSAFLATLAARELGRSVRVSLTRQQMFTLGHRPATWQRIALGAAPDGTLQAVIHDAVSQTSRFEDYTEAVVHWSGLAYACGSVSLDQKVVHLDVNTPCDMRAPGAVWGVYALECAMDELAVALGMDPVELRLKNHADRDQNEDKPISSKELRECYRQGAERIGWARRDPRPRSRREGHDLIGWGMAGGVWDAWQFPAEAKAHLNADGALTVSSATADIGTGTYTIMSQIAADALGLPLKSVRFKLGDSDLPRAPVEGGSFTASSVGTAVRAACEKLRATLLHHAQQIDNSPLAGAKPDDVTFAQGRIRLNRDTSKYVSFADAMSSAQLDAIEETASTGPSEEREKYSSHTHSAIFAEVRVDEDFGTVRVSRIVSAVAAGRILNPTTARSQVLGAIVGGIGTALEEESVMDPILGRYMTRTLADYHVPVNADVNDIDVIFVDERDTIVNPLGAKGLGEIGIIGVAAAIANAVYHATGRRIRDLPITPDKLI